MLSRASFEFGHTEYDKPLFRWMVDDVLMIAAVGSFMTSRSEDDIELNLSYGLRSHEWALGRRQFPDFISNLLTASWIALTSRICLHVISGPANAGSCYSSQIVVQCLL